MPTRNEILRGVDRPPPERIALRAGPLDMVFEPETAFLRYIRLGDREVLRGIYAAVRDRDWGTVAPRVTVLRRDVGADGFQIELEAACTRDEIDFLWRGSLTGRPDGTVVFEMDGAARSAFLRNRIGFCVLHPGKECAGEACTVERTDGSLEHGRFPLRISPDQPFKDIRAITHPAGGGARAEVRFDGDVFEMEDQRNWTDATFKTYCTPLDIPFPVEVRKGDRVRQSVTLRLAGAPPAPAAGPSSREARPARTLHIGKPAGKLPRLGLGTASHGRAPSAAERSRLKALSLHHLRIDLRLSDARWRDDLSGAATLASEIGAALEAAIFLDGADGHPEKDVSAAGEALAASGARIATLLVFREGEKWTAAGDARLAKALLSKRLPGTRIGGGTDAFFAELNRGRPDPAALDVLAYSVNPQVHAFDEASLVETLEAQAWTVESARAFAGDVPIAVTPVTLRPRFNPDATGPPVDPPIEPVGGELPSQVDPRQASLFGAAWTLGSLARLASAGAASITFYETTGWRGVMETAEGSPLPGKFPSVPGSVFPLYHVLADAGEIAGAAVLPGKAEAPLELDGFALLGGKTLRILAANLSPQALDARVDVSAHARSGTGCLRTLDETSALEAMTAPEAFRAREGREVPIEDGTLALTLPPHATVRVDVGLTG